jgi:hypothetical protein
MKATARLVVNPSPKEKSDFKRGEPKLIVLALILLPGSAHETASSQTKIFSLGTPWRSFRDNS